MMQFGDSSKDGSISGMDLCVTVPMPRSLPELQHAAAQNFGHSGCLRLFLHGKTLLYHPAQMNQILDQDIIIVRKTDIHRPVTTPGTPRAISTHQADFTKPAYRRPTTAAGADNESCLTERSRGVPMEGMSRYAMDYVKHPYAAPTPFKPPNAFEMHDEPTGTTTYSREFPWREAAVQKACTNDRALRESSLSAETMGKPLDGTSSYRIDYPRRPYERPEELAMDPLGLRKSSVGPPEGTPFAAVSTYNCDFKKLGIGKQKSCRPKNTNTYMNEPFQGTSEYRREYLERSINDRSMMVQLAQEAFEGLAATALRKMADEAVRTGKIPQPEVPLQSEVEVFP